MEPSLLSLLPPVVLIALAITTKRILLSLAVGIALGALLYSQWNVLASLSLVSGIAGGLIIADGEVAEEVYILAFVLMLGALTSFIYVSGGLRAFSQVAIRKVKTRFHAQLVPIFLGIIIFFDDAFSSLVGGNVSRSITDQHRISRAKLTYLVDSTAAPVIILTPISGWAVFIAATMSGILDENGVTAYSGYEAFLLSVPTNFYAITAILFTFSVAYFGISIGPMRRWERRAVEEGVVVDPSRGPVPGEADRNLPVRDDGKVSDLVVPVLTLIGVTVIGTVWIGISQTDGAITPMQVLANTDVILALFFGGLIAWVLAGARLLAKRTPAGQVARAGLSGIRSMLIAVAVLFMAWMTAEIMSLLGIGDYLAGLIDGALAFALLPALVFVLASFVSFSIGSTFGTFGLLLPIAAAIAVSVDPGLLIPMFGAVLAGAIFGDHTSPLSDTTILSSIGSGIHLIDHVTTQLPYAFVCGVASLVGYVILGLTKNTAVGLLVALATLAVAVFVLRRGFLSETTREPEPGAATEELRE
ncbi:MAG: Na+/H+ antiporter NhaC family protein [Streptosporangiales bacterium]|nr:Na+/H+ antiporter NhaC family protein [Streptosporangiales bacterium]